MPQINFTTDLISALKRCGIATFHSVHHTISSAAVFEAPCSIKWMSIYGDFEIGAHSYAVSGHFLNCSIGRYCSFGETIQIGRGAHPFSAVTTSPFIYNSYKNIVDNIDEAAAVELRLDKVDIRATGARVAVPAPAMTRIENDVWIGHGAFLKPGITVHTGAVIGAHAVVTKDVPPYAVVAGNPARLIRFRFSASISERLLASEWWKYELADYDFSFANAEEFLARFDDAIAAGGLKKVEDRKHIKLTDLINAK